MSFEEDTELRDLVIDTLEKKGVLGKIKAELRASVFLALEDSDFEKCKIPLRNVALQKFMETEEGKTTVALVRDFLESFNLDYTLAVFDPEVSCPSPVKLRKEMQVKLSILPMEDANTPLLLPVLQGYQNKLDIINTTEKSSLDSIINEKNQKPKPTDISTSWLMGNETPIKGKVKHTAESPKDESTEKNGSDSDDFFNEPVGKDGKAPLIFSFMGENSSSKSNQSNSKESPNETFVTKPSALTFEKLSNTSLSSLQNLPTLGTTQVSRKPSVDYEDDFQSSLSSQSDVKKDCKENEADGSIEEDIEEELSGSADDLLNSSLSQGDDLTSDQTVSQLSGKNPEIVYSEKIQ